jgi:hypothetical protein
MLSEIIADIKAFALLYAIIIFAFAHAMMMYSDLSGMSAAQTVGETVREVLETYRMGTLGDFEASEFEGLWQMYALFFAVTVIITVILLNVLIAVISDTYDRLQERMESSSVKSRVQRIAQVEAVFGSSTQQPEYIVFSQIRDEEQDEWSGRVGALKAKIDSSQESAKAERKAERKADLSELKADQAALISELKAELLAELKAISTKT